MTKTSRIRSVELLACDAGWRNYHFVKISTEDGVVGWSEYDEGFGSPGVSAAIQRLSARVVGQNAFPCRAVRSDPPRSRWRSRAGARRNRERAARCQGQAPRRALLRTARRQDSRPRSRLLVALRDLAHQSSELVQATD